jgi:hypothetical protein
MSWERNDFGGFRSASHYVGASGRKFFNVWRAEPGGYRPVAGPFPNANDAKAWAEADKEDQP